MRISAICFTENGYNRMMEVKKRLGTEHELKMFCKCSAIKEKCTEESEVSYVSEPVDRWSADCFEKKTALLFIGAAGIAVRAIAKSVENKLSDSPVIVMDDNGKFVIPLLSGHVGGANELALRVAGCVGAMTVVTTATDVNNAFAVDVFAKKNRLTIANKEGIAKVSSKVLQKKEITIAVGKEAAEKSVIYRVSPTLHMGKAMYWEIEETIEPADVYIGSKNSNVKCDLLLIPKQYVLGIGCRRGKKREEIRDFVLSQLEKAGITKEEVAKITSIDIKSEEEGLKGFAQEMGVPFETYSKQVLNSLKGEFSHSDFVLKKVGVGCVSERAAVAGCMDGNAEVSAENIIVNKQAADGVTLAIAKKKWRLSFNE